MVYRNHLTHHPYVIPLSFSGPPLCNTVIIWPDPPLCNIVIFWGDPSPPICDYVIHGQPLMCWGGKHKRMSSEINWTINYSFAEKLGKQIWMCVLEVFWEQQLAKLVPPDRFNCGASAFVLMNPIIT